MTSLDPTPLRIYVLDLDHTLIHGILKSNYLPLFQNISDVEKKISDMGLIDIGSHIIRLRPHLLDALKQLKNTGVILIYSHASETYGLSVCNVIDPDHKLLEWDGGMIFSPDSASYSISRPPKNLHGLLTQYFLHKPKLASRPLQVIILDDREDVWRSVDQKYLFQLNVFIDWNLYCYEIFRLEGPQVSREPQLKHYSLFLQAMDPNAVRFQTCKCDKIGSKPHVLSKSALLTVFDYMKMYQNYYRQNFEKKETKETDTNTTLHPKIDDKTCVTDIQLIYFCQHKSMYSTYVSFDVFAKYVSVMKLEMFDPDHFSFFDVEEVEVEEEDISFPISVPLAPTLRPRDSRDMDSPLYLPRPTLPFITKQTLQ